MWFMLMYSKLFLFVLLIFIAFTFLVVLNSRMPQFQSVLMILQASVFLGVFLGGSLAKLKKNYLWKNNQYYKSSILNAYFIIAVITGLVLMPLLYSIYNNSFLMLLMPICISIFASQAVLGKNILHKILIPATPIFLLQLIRLQVDINIVYIMIIVTTIVLVYSMYKNLFYTYGSNVHNETKNSTNTIAFMTTGMSASRIISINYSLGVLVSKWIMRSKRTVDWSLLMPHTRLTIITFYYTISMLVLLLFVGIKMRALIGVFSLMILPNLFIGIIMESRHLLRQLKFFSHVFTGNNHRQLKSKILFALDKNMLVNALVYIAIIMLMIQVLSISIPITPLLISMVVIIGVTISIYPLLLCLNWLNISMLLIAIISIYGFSLYKIILWINKNTQLATTIPYVIAFAASCLLLRVITQYIFWNRPIEKLLKNK